MREEYSTILEIDERGRITMSPAARKALGINNKRAILQAVISVIKELNGNPLMAQISPEKVSA